MPRILRHVVDSAVEMKRLIVAAVCAATAITVHARDARTLQIKIAADRDGSFAVTNARTGASQRYDAR